MSQKSKFVSLLLSSALILSQLTAPMSAPASSARARRMVKTKPDTITGTLQGRVIDPGELPLADVRVRVINEETGNFRATKTGANGWYKINLLPLGLYKVEATKEGFNLVRPANQMKIRLNETVTTAPDIVLGPEPPTPPPTVATSPAPPAPAPSPKPAATTPSDDSGRLTNQIDPTRRANSDERMVSLLPLTGVRSFDDLALLAAGVAPPPQVRGVAGPGIGAGIGTAGQFSVNGQRARSNNFTVDGSDNNDEDIGVRRQGFVAMVPQSIESIKEIQIVTHLWDADNGRNIGSQVNAVSKSGGNQIHGSIYDFFNHDSLNARNFFDYTSAGVPSFPLTATKIDRFSNGSALNPRPIPVAVVTDITAPWTQLVQPNPSGGKDQFQRNQGGGVIGFPIVRDRTFFFGSFERQDIKARQETHFSVPTIAQRGYLNYGAGGFRRRDTLGALRSFTPTYTSGDAIFSLFPFPNNPVGPYGENTFTQILAADGHANLYSLKLDHAFRLFVPDVTHEFSARYNSTDDQKQIPSVGGAIFSGVEPKVRTHNLSLSLTTPISAAFANQFRASYGRTHLHFKEIRDPYLLPSSVLPDEPFLLNAPTLVNLSSPATDPSVVLYQSNPNVTVEDALGPIGQVTLSPFSPVGLDVYLFPQARANSTIHLVDSLTYTRGDHTLKFGFDVRRTQLNSFLHRNFRPQVFFGGTPDLTANFSSSTPVLNISKGGPTPSFFSATDLAALGIPTGISQSLAIGAPNSTIGLRSWQLNFFLNENYRVRPGLTFDMGLRYELNTTPQDVNRRIENTF